MRGLVFMGGGVLELQELPAPRPDAAEAILRVEGSAVCIADVETLCGYGPVMGAPLVLGHEIVGVVEDVGDDAAPALKALRGRRVLIDDARPCGVCDWCRDGQRRFCKSPRYGHIVHRPDRQNWGGYAEELTLDSRSVLVPVPDGLSIELATFIFPVASGVEWLMLDANVCAGERVAILGTSRMGAACALVALHQKASQVILYGDARGVDAIRATRAMGASTGGEPAVRASGDLFDVVIVVTEAPPHYAALAVEMAAPRGRVVLACTSMEPSGIVPELIRRKGLTLKGGRGASEGALRTAVDIVTADAGRLSGIVGESYGFEAAESALKGLLNGRAARGAHVVIVSDASRRVL